MAKALWSRQFLFLHLTWQEGLETPTHHPHLIKLQAILSCTSPHFVVNWKGIFSVELLNTEQEPRSRQIAPGNSWLKDNVWEPRISVTNNAWQEGSVAQGLQFIQLVNPYKRGQIPLGRCSQKPCQCLLSTGCSGRGQKVPPEKLCQWHSSSSGGMCASAHSAGTAAPFMLRLILL